MVIIKMEHSNKKSSHRSKKKKYIIYSNLENIAKLQKFDPTNVVIIYSIALRFPKQDENKKKSCNSRIFLSWYLVKRIK